MRRKLLLILSLLCLTASSAWADGSGTVAAPWISGDCKVTLVNGILTVSNSDNGNGVMADYNRKDPDWYGNRSNITRIVIEDGVTYIGVAAFLNCNNASLTISIPASVTNIEVSAFEGCSGLTSITIPASVTNIGASAFYGCSGLTSITIPASVTNIGASAFYGCSNLRSVYVLRNEPDESEGITTLGNVDAFEGCHNDLVIYVPSVDSYKEAEYWINFNNKLKAFNGYCSESDKNGPVWNLTGTSPYYTLTIAGLGAMENLPWYNYLENSITNIAIVDGVTHICNNAFEGCTGLTTITIPASVKTIGDIAFAQCTALTTVTIPASVKTIGEYAFYNCENLTSVTLNSNPAIGTNAFDYLPSNAVVTMNLTAKTAGDAKWMTFYNQNYSFLADENTEVFKVTLSGDVLTMHKVDNRIVDAGTGVVLKSTGNPVMTLTTTASENNDGNNLTGVSDPAGKVSDGTFYVLNYKEGTGVGFYKLESGKTVGVGKAYLTYGDGGGADAREFISFDEATALTQVKSEKRIVNSEVYDLQGRRVVNPTKGLYIVNGKKVVIK